MGHAVNLHPLLIYFHITYFHHYDGHTKRSKGVKIGSPNVLMISANFNVELGEWYKFTIIGTSKGTGKNDGRDCRQEYLIEGPGLKNRDEEGKWSYALDTWCLDMEEGFPLKVFGAKNVLGSSNRSKPMDGVLRNVAFENTATDTSINTVC